ncbi:maleylacetoacetate isomerase [Sphingorhabdus lutea]|uniref:Maleylacetoacetate isomerase n=1 Tax=Sphingorhabdus lutea TaxID=1913578 RepID=A0A1L3JBQ3_9SPHN|nr:maleylacetoacetate isomerase [Sphingorhabdus lutea]APG62529.1 maleylacetoacetate isomerase [Sphingorhabdus lutea]
MSDIILYDYFRSSASYRVRIALNLKEINYKSIPTSLLQGAEKTPEYLALNPQGFVPMLHIDGMDLTQSLAIIEYLDAQYPAPLLLPKNPAQRAKQLSHALIITADIHPVNNLRILKYLKGQMGQDQEAVDNWYRHWIVEGFTALEAYAPQSGLFGGDMPNLVDVCLVPQIYNARRFNTDLSEFPKLIRIDAQLNQLPAFQNAHPDMVEPK